MHLDIETSIEFAKSAALPEIEDFGLDIEDAGDPPNFDKPELAVTVGSQIASFADNVEPELREKIANGFLFAQQAANKQIDGATEASSFAWYKTYVHVLTQIGWMTEEDARLDRIIKGTSVQVHKEIIPILSAALGPAAATSALVVKVLEGLSQMDADSRWFTIFDSASQRAQANQFQMSHIDKVDGAPRINLVNFELAAERSVKQVLFFKLDTNRAELRHTENEISVNEPIFSEVAPIIADRLQDRIRQFVMDIDI
ncbi:hypothetical protein Q5Y75_00560 [Ruegeria sp. 2205SS24-7]|uniref:hypothetical protein n=1 Tax=Ruegeria discodermiae TaxID=3064389 RepID=UPI002741B4B1|nr:hypothetical protein [Ruegeria sp. 2205SS24-7]MDP5215699.1 hypothetical protein [Ruegeria sp. 2205SS24-7]